MKEVEIPKGFLGTPEQFMDEFKLLCDKYGYDQWLVGVSSINDKDHDAWEGGSNAVSESMIEYLKEIQEQMEETLKNL